MIFPELMMSALALVQAPELESIVYPNANLEVYFDDKSWQKLLKKPLVIATETVEGMFPPIAAPEPVRVIVLKKEENVRAYQQEFASICGDNQVSPPPDSFFDSVAKVGSGYWTFPPLCMVYTQGQSKAQVMTRVIHDYGALRISLAISEQAYGCPEFLAEGFAGLLLRRSLKKPVALVSHEGAAEKDRVHGYGVFAGIGGAVNDYSNAPSNWVMVMKNALKVWRKKGEVLPEEMIDSLVRRPKSSFARTDYAYSWAVVEFLMEQKFPYGDDAALFFDDKKWKPKLELKQSRLSLLRPIFGELREKKMRTLNAKGRAEMFLKLLYEESGETPEQMHAAFMHWLEKGMPKK